MKKLYLQFLFEKRHSFVGALGLCAGAAMAAYEGRPLFGLVIYIAGIILEGLGATLLEKEGGSDNE